MLSLPLLSANASPLAHPITIAENSTLLVRRIASLLKHYYEETKTSLHSPRHHSWIVPPASGFSQWSLTERTFPCRPASLHFRRKTNTSVPFIRSLTRKTAEATIISVPDRHFNAIAFAAGHASVNQSDQDRRLPFCNLGALSLDCK